MYKYLILILLSCAGCKTTEEPKHPLFNKTTKHFSAAALESYLQSFIDSYPPIYKELYPTDDILESAVEYRLEKLTRLFLKNNPEFFEIKNYLEESIVAD